MTGNFLCLTLKQAPIPENRVACGPGLILILFILVKPTHPVQECPPLVPTPREATWCGGKNISG